MVPGASKCGTTSLWYYLKQHPDIYLSPVKEPHFFDSDLNYTNGIGWYYSQCFPSVRQEKIVGEMTPGYLYKHDLVIPRIQDNIANNIKFIIMLRDPVKRAWSHYLHMVRNEKEVESFETALELEDTRLKNNTGWFSYYYEGLYGYHLSKWFKAFGKECFLVLELEQMQKEPKEFFHQIFEFLEIKTISIDTSKKLNQNSVIKYKRLHKFIKSPPTWAKAIYRLTFKSFIKFAYKRSILDRLIEINLKKSEDTLMLNKDTEIALRKKFLNDIQVLEAITGKRLSKWRI